MENDKGGVHISGVQGDVSGIISGGTGNIGGKYAVVGSGTIDVSEEQLGRIQNKAAETAATFTPLVPFSKLIGKGMQEI
ncbi:MAG: hypothetical protein WCC17_13655 [Candidatus Nitrosopolaris sp.]|jgi:hypothetical protein